MPLIETIGGIAANAGMGLMLADANDRRQLRQQEKLQQLQIRGNKEMGDYNYAKQLQMWKDTSYGAQKEMMEKAGLNPALMYGMSGGGGTTTGSAGAGVSGGEAPKGGGEAIAGAGMGLQMGMQNAAIQAQIELTKAQTEKTKAEANKTAGVDTQEAETRISNLLQGITNQKQQKALMDIDEKLKNIDLTVQKETMTEMIDRIEWEAETSKHILEMAEREAYMQKATMNNKIDMVKTEWIGALLRNVLTKAQTENTKQDTGLKAQQTKTAFASEGLLTAQQKATIQGMMVEWENLSVDQQRNKILEALKDWQTEVPRSVEMIMGALQGTIGEIIGGVGSKSPRKIGFK